MTTAEKFKELCRKNHWKCTPQRLAVYTFMEHNLDHPSVDAVWESVRKTVPAITRESVYRILNEFAGADILYRMDKIESAHYDSRLVPHGHLVCEQCGAVHDFPFDFPVPLPSGLQLAEIRHVELRLSYVCPNCRKAK